jgi:7-cyano-7-deazaguanine reductase
MSNEVYREVLEGLRQLEPVERRRAFATLKREREAEQAQAKEDQIELPNSHWSKKELLQRIPNPGSSSYEQKILIPEFTFLGVANQPDFGEMLITFYPKEWTIELKSLKVYKDAFRGSIVSYERLCNVVYDDLMGEYEPIRLRLMMRLRPRGGISSCLTIDSDWAIRGGKEQFSDWNHNTDRFGFNVTGSMVSSI